MKKTYSASLNKKLSDAILVALRDFHEQVKGVRVIEVTVSPDDLNPPGVFYNIKVQAQVTFGPEYEKKEEDEEAPS